MTPGTPLFDSAIAAFQAGRLDEAERYFKQLLAREPRHLGALNILGVLLASQHKYAQAEPYLREALSIQASSDSTLSNYGIVLKGLGRSEDALKSFSSALAINPNAPDTWNNRGIVYNGLERYAEALADFDRALALAADPGIHCNRARSLHSLDRPEEALAAFEKALALRPNLAEAWIGRGHVLLAIGRASDALDSYSRATRLPPPHPEAWIGQGRAQMKLRQYEQAAASFGQAATLQPGHTEAELGRAHALRALRSFDEALAEYDRILAANPQSFEAWLGRGNVLYERANHEGALAAYSKAVGLEPAEPAGWVGCGNALTGLERFDDALAQHDKALTLDADVADAWLGRGNALMGLKQYEQALLAQDKALSHRADFTEAWLGRGNVLFSMARLDDALTAYDKALVLAPDFAPAWLGRANVHFWRKNYEEARLAYEKALNLDPTLPEVWNACGHILALAQQHDKAVAAYDRALALKPFLNGAAGLRLQSKMWLCDWSNFDTECANLLSQMRDGRAVSSPGALLAMPSGPEDQLQCARQWVANNCPAQAPMVEAGRTYQHDRIRLAYLSADFRDHPVAQALAELMERHDRSRFEIIGLSIGHDDGSSLRGRIVKSFDRFHDLRAMTDTEASQLIRELETDILVKVAPHTEDSRLGILAHRPAPIQVNGFCAWTSGADFVDYVLADPRALPFTEQRFVTEQIVHLPDSYFPPGSPQEIAAVTATRANYGLPEKGFVFCSFNQSYKLNPQIFDVWMRLLERIDGSVLWLAHYGDQTTANLRREAEARSVDPSRLVFAPRLPSLGEHLARHRAADLFLDTLPYGAHTTSKDALWAGLPVLTCRGDTFVGRIAVSQLHAVGLPELIADSLDAYEAAALRLAQHPDELHALRDRLAANRTSYPLFDNPRLCRHFEAAYAQMWERHQRGIPPQGFTVNPLA